MIELKASYINLIHKNKNTKTDYFVYTDVEVKGHAEHTGYTNNTRVCAGISACCLGIVRLIDTGKFYCEYRSGYFHCWTNVKDLRSLDKESVYALNTLVCQVYEIYCNYPTAFKCFELIDLKETLSNEQRTKQPCYRKPHRKRKMGLHSIIESIDFEENT